MKHLSCCFFCIFSFLFLVNCHAQNKQVEDFNQTNTLVLSKKYIELVENADSIVWYLVDPMCEVDTTSLQLEGYGEILLVQTDTTLNRCNALKSTLIYPCSFENMDMVKESTFLPDVVIRFFSANSILTFSYSFYCDLCHFECDGKYQELDGELIRRSIIQMSAEVFPYDRYLRDLKRREE